MRVGGLGVAIVSALVTAACVGNDPTPTGSSGTSSGTDAATTAATAGARAIRCGGTACQGDDVCCIATTNGEYASAMCTARAACVTTFLECDSTHDCPMGLVCCANTNGGSFFWASSACAASCAGSQRQLCDDATECTGGCLANPPAVSPPNLRACPK